MWHPCGDPAFQNVSLGKGVTESWDRNDVIISTTAYARGYYKLTEYRIPFLVHENQNVISKITYKAALQNAKF